MPSVVGGVEALGAEEEGAAAWNPWVPAEYPRKARRRRWDVSGGNAEAEEGGKEAGQRLSKGSWNLSEAEDMMPVEVRGLRRRGFTACPLRLCACPVGGPGGDGGQEHLGAVQVHERHRSDHPAGGVPLLQLLQGGVPSPSCGWSPSCPSALLSSFSLTAPTPIPYHIHRPASLVVQSLARFFFLEHGDFANQLIQELTAIAEAGIALSNLEAQSILEATLRESSAGADLLGGRVTLAVCPGRRLGKRSLPTEKPDRGVLTAPNSFPNSPSPVVSLPSPPPPFSFCSKRDCRDFRASLLPPAQ